MFNLLIVDDDDHVLKSLARLLRSKEYNITCLSDPREARLLCVSQNFDLIISDQRMPDMEGTELFAHIAQSFPETRRVLISGYSDFSSVTDAFNDNIIHKFVIKPWDNSGLKALVAEQLEIKQRGSDEPLLKNEQVAEDKDITAMLQEEAVENFHGIVTADAVMLQQFSIISRTANSGAPFFIHGETGTGKELIARAIQLESERAGEKFVALNCANLTENLLESQLFGHMKGAFTGADKDQKGLLAEAEKGSLFLDEVTEIPLPLQAKLLRVLQEREYSPVGQTKTIPFDVQVISASSTSLESAVNAGQFREDLRYRLEVIPLNLPPLRERKADIRTLFDYFSVIQFKRQQRELNQIADEVYNCIENYSWPGNVREMVNVCTYVAALSTEAGAIIDRDKLPPVIRSTKAIPGGNTAAETPKKPVPPVSGSRAITPEALVEALAQHGGNREAVASQFGISRMTLWRKMKQFAIEG